MRLLMPPFQGHRQGNRMTSHSNAPPASPTQGTRPARVPSHERVKRQLHLSTRCPVCAAWATLEQAATTVKLQLESWGRPQTVTVVATFGAEYVRWCSWRRDLRSAQKR